MLMGRGQYLLLKSKEGTVDSKVMGLVIGGLLFSAVVGCAVSPSVYTRTAQKGI